MLPVLSEPLIKQRLGAVASLGIHRRRRLVEQQGARREEQRPHERHQLRFSAGEIGAGESQERFAPPDCREHPAGGIAVETISARATQNPRDFELVDDGALPDHRRLLQVDNLAPEGRHGVASGPDAAPLDVAAGERIEEHQGAQQ